VDKLNPCSSVNCSAGYTCLEQDGHPICSQGADASQGQDDRNSRTTEPLSKSDIGIIVGVVVAVVVVVAVIVALVITKPWRTPVEPVVK